MPVYLVHGFRWPREGFTGIRVHAIVQNLEDCSVEYIQNENSKQDILESFQKMLPDAMKELGPLDFIEQYDPDDLSDRAVSQPYAYVADKVVTIAGGKDDATATASTPLSMNVEEVIADGPGLSSQAWEALADLRDKIAEGEKIGWWIVYNGDPERGYDSDEETERVTTPTQEPVSAPEEKPAVPPKSPTTPSALPIREKAVEQLPSPTKETVPEPPKLKEVAKASGFRKKFFGKKS